MVHGRFHAYNAIKRRNSPRDYRFSGMGYKIEGVEIFLSPLLIIIEGSKLRFFYFASWSAENFLSGVIGHGKHDGDIGKKFLTPMKKILTPLKFFGGLNFYFFILGRGALKIATRGFSDMRNTMVTSNRNTS